jgi:hypothetical protein
VVFSVIDHGGGEKELLVGTDDGTNKRAT